jgi:23S rRNA pseudouridine1911/1915/1917 synthase
MRLEAAFEFRTGEEASGRLDKYLAAAYPDWSRTLFTRIIKEGLVLVDGRKVKPSAAVKPGALISVQIPPPRLPEIVPENIPLDVIYEDSDILAVNKPAGLVVHPAYGHERGTLVNALLFRTITLSALNGPERPGIVHRLDRDTTGVIVIAKNDSAHMELGRMFADREVKKEYLAIAAGEMRSSPVTVDEPIGRSKFDRKKMAVRRDGGREALTVFDAVEKFRGFTFVRCRPKTGRTHQIRLHLKHLNLPVLCDEMYSNRSVLYESELAGKKRLEKEIPLIERQALHAAAINFKHPRSGEEMNFSAPIPEDMERTLEAMRRLRKI